MIQPNMPIAILRQLTQAHLRVLAVCQKETKDGGSFCGEWIMHACDEQGVPFHQGWLTKLANVGLLEKDHSSRAGHRRYYRIKNPELVQAVLRLAGVAQPVGRFVTAK